MGYPDEASEKRMLTSGQHRVGGASALAAVQIEQVIALQKIVGEVKVGKAVADYAWRIIHASRTDGHFVDGLSPRAGMAWMRAAQAWALIEGRAWVTPDDIQAVFQQCAIHRLQTKSSVQMSKEESSAALISWLKNIPIEASGD